MENIEQLPQKLSDVFNWSINDALLDPQVRQHLTELKVAKKHELKNQIKAHADEIKVICLKKWFGLIIGWEGWSGEKIVIKNTLRVPKRNGKTIDEYKKVMPLSKLEPIIALNKTKIFDEIKVYDEVENAGDDPVIIGKIGIHYLLLAQWE